MPCRRSLHIEKSRMPNRLWTGRDCACHRMRTNLRGCGCGGNPKRFGCAGRLNFSTVVCCARWLVRGRAVGQQKIARFCLGKSWLARGWWWFPGARLGSMLRPIAARCRFRGRPARWLEPASTCITPSNMRPCFWRSRKKGCCCRCLRRGPHRCRSTFAFATS